MKLTEKSSEKWRMWRQETVMDLGGGWWVESLGWGRCSRYRSNDRTRNKSGEEGKASQRQREGRRRKQSL